MSTTTTETKSQLATPKYEGIALSGKMGSGKDYIALNMIFAAFNVVTPTLIVCLADLIKINTVVFDKADFDQVFGGNRDEKTRTLLQVRGTEQGRDKYGPDVWIRALTSFMKMHALRGIQYFIVCDVRFENERLALEELGFRVYRIHAPQRTQARVERESKGDEVKKRNISSHASEVALDNCKSFVGIIPNDIGEEIKSQDFVNEHIIRPQLRKWQHTIQERMTTLSLMLISTEKSDDSVYDIID